MKDELKGFENRENDWLAREMRREAKLSPWNVDEAKIIKEEHARIHAKEIHFQQKIRKKEPRYQHVSAPRDITKDVLIYLYVFIALLAYIIFKIIGK